MTSVHTTTQRIGMKAVLMSAAPLRVAQPLTRDELIKTPSARAFSSSSAALHLSTNALLDFPGWLEWPAPLMQFQIDGVKVILSRSSLLLADQMGLSKTVQLLAALRVLSLRRQV